MLSEDALRESEEAMRLLVRDLPDDRRLAYHRLAEKRLRDPDTFAVLCYIPVVCLQHFYLGQWLLGFSILFGFIFALVMLFTPLFPVGLLVILVLVMIELFHLFWSQRIVQTHNLILSQAIYREVSGAP